MNASLHVNGHSHIRAPQVGADTLQNNSGHKRKAITAKYSLFNILNILRVKGIVPDWGSSCQSEKSTSVFHKIFCSRTRFWFRILATDILIFADVNIEFPDGRYRKLKMYISKMVLNSEEYIGAA